MNHIVATNVAGPITVAVVCSEFNQEITERLLAGALDELKQAGVPEDEITVVHVPGAIEIPLAVQELADTGCYDAVIALGAVIRGETSHYDYVCQQVSQGCQRVGLDYQLPVIFGVLTTEDEAQALERTGGAHGHKGREAAQALLAMISVLHQIRSAHPCEEHKDEMGCCAHV